jgi:hypothetical protein
MAGKKRMTVGKLGEPKYKEMTGQEIMDFLSGISKNRSRFNVRCGDRGCLSIFQQGVVEIKHEGNPPQPVAVLIDGRLEKHDGRWVFRSQKGVSFPVVALSRE